MAKQDRAELNIDKRSNGSNTLLLLMLFLSFISASSIGALYLELRHKHSLLQAKVEKLENSQVLLMVPTEQAESLAQWMEKNPTFTEAMLEQVRPGQHTRVEVTAATQKVQLRNTQALATEQSSLTSSNMALAKNQADKISAPVTVSEDKDGVKLIKLPGGGIRITTRDES
ncbi:membrane anchored protein in chemotaxis locus [Shewanella sp. Isolate11]|uniref:membrane anchored protein in chemotaxis locus n=1 Tax=Shewanella sp. Isolate11 TaxID=2908530 RepID=UPI001EFDB0FF|nr:membrane anchored protein in chemotaxis locus [Shewanella sp. Isolate11]MCG9697130.1 membrane anchored protein in chemotaxis locus [Shewanella sp. Isolate11]